MQGPARRGATEAGKKEKPPKPPARRAGTVGVSDRVRGSGHDDHFLPTNGTTHPPNLQDVAVNTRLGCGGRCVFIVVAVTIVDGGDARLDMVENFRDDEPWYPCARHHRGGRASQIVASKILDPERCRGFGRCRLPNAPASTRSFRFASDARQGGRPHGPVRL